MPKFSNLTMQHPASTNIQRSSTRILIFFIYLWEICSSEPAPFCNYTGHHHISNPDRCLFFKQGIPAVLRQISRIPDLCVNEGHRTTGKNYMYAHMVNIIDEPTQDLVCNVVLQQDQEQKYIGIGLQRENGVLKWSINNKIATYTNFAAGEESDPTKPNCVAMLKNGSICEWYFYDCQRMPLVTVCELYGFNPCETDNGGCGVATCEFRGNHNNASCLCDAGYQFDDEGLLCKKVDGYVFPIWIIYLLAIIIAFLVGVAVARRRRQSKAVAGTSGVDAGKVGGKKKEVDDVGEGGEKGK